MHFIASKNVLLIDPLLRIDVSAFSVAVDSSLVSARAESVALHGAGFVYSGASQTFVVNTQFTPHRHAPVLISRQHKRQQSLLLPVLNRLHL